MSRKRAYELAEKIGAVITDDGDTVILDAPAGYEFGLTSHSFSYDCTDTRKGVWAQLIEDLKSPLYICENTACDFCADN